MKLINKNKRLVACVGLLALLCGCCQCSGQPAPVLNTDLQQTELVPQMTEEATENFEGKDFLIDPEGTTIATRFINKNPNYERRTPDGFGQWLLDLKLFPDGHVTKYFDGSDKYQDRIWVGVVDMDLVGYFNRNGKEYAADLQQCADACMRLRAEYLWQTKQYGKIHFKSSAGEVFRYTEWVAKHGNDYSYITFRKYLSKVFAFCGTLSLSLELKKVKITDVRPGDLLILGGSPGHAVMVMDVLHEKNGEGLKLMFSQSYMPAQQIEILCNRYDNDSPWKLLEHPLEEVIIPTPQWNFDLSRKSCFMRWTDD